jgi:hypothetical protein
LWPDLLDGNTHGDAAFGFHFVSVLVPLRMLAVKPPVPIDHDIHRLRMSDNLRPAVDLDVIGSVKPITEDQQGDLGVAANVFYLVSFLPRGEDHPALPVDNRRNQGHLQRAVALARHQHALMVVFQEFLRLDNFHTASR